MTEKPLQFEPPTSRITIEPTEQPHEQIVRAQGNLSKLFLVLSELAFPQGRELVFDFSLADSVESFTEDILSLSFVIWWQQRGGAVSWRYPPEDMPSLDESHAQQRIDELWASAFEQAPAELKEKFEALVPGGLTLPRGPFWAPRRFRHVLFPETFGEGVDDVVKRTANELLESLEEPALTRPYKGVRAVHVPTTDQPWRLVRLEYFGDQVHVTRKTQRAGRGMAIYDTSVTVHPLRGDERETIARRLRTLDFFARRSVLIAREDLREHWLLEARIARDWHAYAWDNDDDPACADLIRWLFDTCDNAQDGEGTKSA